MLSEIDVASVIVITGILLAQHGMKQRFAAMDEISAHAKELRSKKAILGKQGTWTLENEQVLKNLEVNAAAIAFRSWTGRNSIIVTPAAGLISLLLGFTTVPGVLIGAILSSPRMGFLMMRIFGSAQKSSREADSVGASTSDIRKCIFIISDAGFHIADELHKMFVTKNIGNAVDVDSNRFFQLMVENIHYLLLLVTDRRFESSRRVFYTTMSSIGRGMNAFYALNGYEVKPNGLYTQDEAKVRSEAMAASEKDGASGTTGLVELTFLLSASKETTEDFYKDIQPYVKPFSELTEGLVREVLSQLEPVFDELLRLQNSPSDKEWDSLNEEALNSWTNQFRDSA